MNSSAVSPAVKDVEALLLKERSCRRRPGDVPYPLDYNMEMLNLYGVSVFSRNLNDTCFTAIYGTICFSSVAAEEAYLCINLTNLLLLYLTWGVGAVIGR